MQRCSVMRRPIVRSLVLALGACLVVFVAQAQADPYQVAELVRGGRLHGANGTYVGPDGHLYVASLFGGEIAVFDVDSGEVVRRFGSADGVLGPDDVTFGPDGSMYWTDLMMGEVGRRAPDGTVTKQFVAPGVNPITFSDDGRLFVALAFLGDGLFELDPELVDPPRPIVVGTAADPFPFGFFNAFDFGADGRLYGPLYATEFVISFDVDSCEATSRPWTDCDIVVAGKGFRAPVAAKFDPRGVLHVLDAWTGQLSTVDLGSGTQTPVVELGRGTDNLAFDATGRLFVSNSDDGSVVEVLPDGTVRTVNPGGLILPSGVAVLERPGGGASVFVADLFRLWEFDATTGALLGFDTAPLVGAGMVAPISAWADGEHLVLTSMMHVAAQVIDPWSGEVVERHAATGFPYGAVRVGADLVLSDPMAGGVVWASTGEPILAIDEQQVFLPVGLATDGERLWVSDWATGTVWRVDFEGTAALPAVPVATGLANPEGLALDHAGGLLVMESGTGRLSRIDLATGEVEEIATGLEIGLPAIGGVPPSYVSSSVAVDADGTIFAAGDLGNVLYRITKR